jgi:hypothetical protein
MVFAAGLFPGYRQGSTSILAFVVYRSPYISFSRSGFTVSQQILGMGTPSAHVLCEGSFGIYICTKHFVFLF